MTWKPNPLAALVYNDAEIQIWADGTWRPTSGNMTGWVAHGNAVVYAAAAGDAKLTTRLGRSKISRVTSPSGRILDIRGIANGTKQAPPLP